MQQVPEKQKKQLITLSLAGAVLLAGIVAGFLVVQNQQFIQNRAATTPINCQMATGTCTLPSTEDSGYTPFIMYAIEIDGDSQKTVATSAQGDTKTPLTFAASPLKRYKCEVAPVSITKDCNPISVEQSAPLCQPPDDNNPPPTATPQIGGSSTGGGDPDIVPGDPGTSEKACACGADGGVLECKTKDTKIEGNLGNDGPGLIILNPKYSTGKAPRCFQCEKLVVSDGTREVGSYDCISPVPSGPVPTGGYLIPTPGIRLHIANGEICRDYSVAVIGKSDSTGTTSQSPISCASCTGRVCCPACQPPVKFDDCDPEKCDFDITVEGGALCGAIGKSITAVPKGSKNYSFDFDEAPYDTLNANPHRYKNSGVYDIKMSCNVDPSTGIGKTCTQRITIGCGAVTTTPSFPDTTYNCPEIKVNPPVCIYD